MAKVKAYYKHGLSGLVASATASGYDAANLLIFLEGSLWKGVGTGTHTITFDAGDGNTIKADYVGVANHNLSGATFKLQTSTDNFAADTKDVLVFSPSDNLPFLKEFVDDTKRYWRIELTGLTAVPFMAIAYWGLLSEWDFPALFDPNAEEDQAIINESETGYLLGINIRYIKREIDVKFRGVLDKSVLWLALRAWWDDHGMKLFFIAWDTDDHPDDVYFVRSEKDYKGPFISAVHREVTLKFTGRVSK